MRYARYASLVALFFVFPAFAQVDPGAVAESIVLVRAYDGNRLEASGTGFVVNRSGEILTNAHLVQNAERLTVVTLHSGAELLSHLVFSSRETNLALLRVQGLDLLPLELTEQGMSVGRVVETLRLSTRGPVRVSRGTIGAYVDLQDQDTGDPVVRLLQHNALVTSLSFGMPLFNECGDVVAINLPDPISGHWPYRRDTEPEGTVFAVRSGNIIAMLRAHDIEHTVNTEECLTAVERAEREQINAEQRVQTVRDSISALAKAASDSLMAERSARIAAERASVRMDSISEVAAKRTEETEEALETEKAARVATEKAARVAMVHAADSLAAVRKSEQEYASRRMRWIVVSGSGLIVLALLGWVAFAWRKKGQLRKTSSLLSDAKREAEAARRLAAEAPRAAPFRCLLEGRDESGTEYALLVPAMDLASGVTLGRSPATADILIDHEGVSREHVRLHYVDGSLLAEDLDSMNGTKIDGYQLVSHQQSELEDGARVELGPIVLRVRLMPE